MHGLGAYRGLRQTNTYDAMVHWYNKGIRVFEIDMAKTTDGKYVAIAHDLSDKALRRVELFSLPENRTQDWFMAQKLFSISTHGLKPLSLESIIDFTKEKEDVVVMLDLFGMFGSKDTKLFVESLQEIVGSATSIWSRLLLEAYNLYMIQGIQQAGDLAQIIYCARYEGNADKQESISPNELLRRGISFVSYPWRYSKQHPREIREYANANITVFTRTVFNTKDRQLKVDGVSVNIIAKRFDGVFIVGQLPIYMASYVKRILVKIYIATVCRRKNGSN